MLAYMREEMAKQQAMFDRERKQAAHDRENVAREWGEMKCLNDQLLGRPFKTPGHLHRQKGPLLRRPKATSILKDGGDACQTLQLHRNNPTGWIEFVTSPHE